MYTEGFWGKGKWVDRYFVLEENILNCFVDERSFIKSAKEPIER